MITVRREQTNEKRRVGNQVNQPVEITVETTTRTVVAGKWIFIQKSPATPVGGSDEDE